jgi:hypothetical protein
LDGDNVQRSFHDVDLGKLTARSGYSAIGQRGRVQIWGLPGGLVWLMVHLVFLTGFKNRERAVLLGRHLLRPVALPAGHYTAAGSGSRRCAKRPPVASRPNNPNKSYATAKKRSDATFLRVLILAVR